MWFNSVIDETQGGAKLTRATDIRDGFKQCTILNQLLGFLRMCLGNLCNNNVDAKFSVDQSS